MEIKENIGRRTRGKVESRGCGNDGKNPWVVVEEKVLQFNHQWRLQNPPYFGRGSMDK